MQDFLEVGQIVKPQGIKGELKVKPLTDDFNRFKSLKEIIIDGTSFKIVSLRINQEFVFLTLFGVNDRNSAESFRGKSLLVKRENAVPLKENTFFIVDILGASVYGDDVKIGEIIDITTAKTDVFTVKTVDDKIMRFPFLKDLLIKVDLPNKAVYLKKRRLDEVSVYED